MPYDVGLELEQRYLKSYRLVGRLLLVAVIVKLFSVVILIDVLSSRGPYYELMFWVHAFGSASIVYLIGVLISALAHLVRLSTDNAINTSPLLTDDQRYTFICGGGRANVL
ncbi:MAG: hypothetical protein ACKVT0_20380 [Planctomycetaceae bacterium]